MRFSSVSKLAAMFVLCLSASTMVGCAADAETPGGDVDSEDSEIARKTTLTFFLVGREWNSTTHEWKQVPLDSLTADLERVGLAPFHKAITVGAQEGAKFKAILDRVEEANQKLHREIELEATWDPSEYKGLCYNGTAAGVMKTVDGLRGSAFSEYMGVQAERYGTRKKVHNSTEEEWLRMQREDNDQADTIKAWENFDTRSDAFLMMTDGGQQGDGTELFAVLIPKCR
jgi:hypothetical protein